MLSAPETILSGAGLEPALSQFPDGDIQNRERNGAPQARQQSQGHNLSSYISFLRITFRCTNPQNAFSLAMWR